MILALVMALALVACGNKNTDDGKKDNPDDNKTPTVITNPDKVQDEMTSSTACPTSTISPPTAVRPPMMTASPL